MKLKFLSMALLGMTVMLSSCYTSEICVGNVKADDPVTKTASVKNPHLIGGLIKLGKGKVASNYVGDRKDYKIRTQHSFVDVVLECVTLGIYTPTTTTFYTPVK